MAYDLRHSFKHGSVSLFWGEMQEVLRASLRKLNKVSESVF